MDSKELKGLMEAYAEVYAPQEEIDEAVKGADPEMRKAASAERRAGDKPLSKKVGDANAAHMARKIRFSDKVTKAKGHIPGYTYAEEVEQVDEAITSEKGKAKAAAMIAARTTASGRAKSGQGDNVATIKHIGRSEREGLRGTPMTPTMAKNPAKSRTFSGTGNKAARRAGLTPTREKPNAWKEEFDIFDIVLEFLQAEGYAETLEQAEWMMVNELDSEDIDAIVIGEADSLAAFQARREKRRAAMKKKTGYEGHDYSKPHAQAAAEREQRMRDFLDKK